MSDSWKDIYTDAEGVVRCSRCQHARPTQPDNSQNSQDTSQTNQQDTTSTLAATTMMNQVASSISKAMNLQSQTSQLAPKSN